MCCQKYSSRKPREEFCMRLWIYPIKIIKAPSRAYCYRQKMTNKKPYKSTSPRGVLTCKALISSYNLDIIILFVLRFMPRSLNYIPARLTLADFAMFFAIEIITCRTNNDFAKPLSSLLFDNIILCSTQKN